MHETSARPGSASSASSGREGAASARSASTRKPNGEAARGAKQESTRDAKTAVSDAQELDEMAAAEAFAGVDTTAPVDDVTDERSREVSVKGIEGTMTEYDVRSILTGRDEDFDRCHDKFRGGSGRLEFRIHILSDGDVGDVKVRRSKVRNQDLVACYTEVVATSHFNAPHGGYADVKWTTKVGRSRRRPDAIFERRVRWDAPVGSQTQDESSASRRERRNARRNRT